MAPVGGEQTEAAQKPRGASRVPIVSDEAAWPVVDADDILQVSPALELVLRPDPVFRALAVALVA